MEVELELGQPIDFTLDPANRNWPSPRSAESPLGQDDPAGLDQTEVGYGDSLTSLLSGIISRPKTDRLVWHQTVQGTYTSIQTISSGPLPGESRRSRTPCAG